LSDPLPPTDIKITTKKDELQIYVILPSSEKSNFDELRLHGYTDTSESVLLQKVHLNDFDYAINSQTDKQTQRKPHRQIKRPTHRQIYITINRPTHRHTDANT